MRLSNILLSLFTCTVLLACQSTESTQKNYNALSKNVIEPLLPSDYNSDFRYPKETSSLVLVKQHNNDEPLFGSSIHYENRYFDQDHIYLYAYPIRHLNWNDKREILQDEINTVFVEIDNAIEEGIYSSREGKVVTPFNTKLNGKEYKGLRAHTNIYTASGTHYSSYVYIFMQKDKFVKFRISQPNAQLLGAPDEMVEEVLPYLEVPDESTYMANLRKKHNDQYQ